MAEKKNPLGPTGQTVCKNIERHRLRLNLGYAELSRRLEEHGRTIPTLGLSRIEKGERRVDADDLVALSIALEVTPITLLMPETPLPEDVVEATGDGGQRVTARALWGFLTARTPLRGGNIRDLAEFHTRAVPSWAFQLLTAEEQRQAREEADARGRD